MIPPLGATPEGTSKFKKEAKDSVHPDKWRVFQDLNISALALGTYLGNYDEATDKLYEEAVSHLINKGANFIDSAINYRCQRSERSIGRALHRLFEKKDLRRNEVVVATKGGFIPFDSEPMTHMDSYIKKTWIDTGLVTKEDIVSSCHCMHPQYLQKQIETSLQNLQLDTIDLYYLHNPETQLPVVGEEEFYKRLESAFTLLEENADRGKIQYYGLATWNAFRQLPGASDALSLERVVKIAQKVGGDKNRFKAIQLPYNMAMLEAIGTAGQHLEGKTHPIVPIAYHFGVSVMVSIPLLQSQLLHLPQTMAKRLPGSYTLAQKALQFVTSTPGITAAMVGMKQEEHLNENLAVLKFPNWDRQTLQEACDQLVKKDTLSVGG